MRWGRAARRSGDPPGGSFDPDGVDDVVEGLPELGVFLEEPLDLVDGVEDRRVVLAAEALADVGEGIAGELVGEVHGDLAGKGDGLGPGLGAQVVRLDAEDVADATLDVVDRDEAFLGAPDVGEYLLREVEAELAAGEAAEGADAHEGALEFADVGLDLVRDEVGEIVGEGHAVELGLLLEDGDAGLEVGRLDVGDQAPLEPGAEALLDLRDLLRRAVAR